MNVHEEHIAITRSARIYSLGDASSANDVWIVCHGYGQLAGRWIEEFQPIAGDGRLIVAPEGLHRFYIDPPPAPASRRRVGATWMTREDRATDIADYVRYLDAVLDHVGAESARIRALGFSQGCATVVRWAAMGKSRIDELILWTGEVPPDVDMQPAAARLRQTRIVLTYGTNDDLIPQTVQARNRELLDSAGLSYQVHHFEGGHHMDDGLLKRLI